MKKITKILSPGYLYDKMGFLSKIKYHWKDLDLILTLFKVLYAFQQYSIYYYNFKYFFLLINF